MEKRYLLGITVGPVQEYIVESRKLIDLCNSSKILSHIMINILNYITEKDTRSENIYPYTMHDIKESIDCSNFMIFKVNESIFNELQKDKLEEAVYGALFNNMDEKFKQYVDKLEFINAFKENFFLFWGAEEFKKDSNYKKIYNNLISFMRNIKNTYEFDNDCNEDNVLNHNNKKCSICGKRNIKVVKEKNDRARLKLNDSEDLCSFCLIKRNYKTDTESYGSIYDVSVSQWLDDNFKDTKIKNQIDSKLKEVFEENSINKFYKLDRIKNVVRTIDTISSVTNVRQKEKLEASISSDLLNKNNITGQKERIKANLIELKKIYEKNNISEPLDEYSFIQFDVDSLGKWMSGEYIFSNESIRRFQTELSKKLCEFGIELRKNLKENSQCKVIYSGGDDFLGILPIENIKTVVEIIEDCFNRKITKNEEFQNTLHQNRIRKKVTYSISITIAQCKDPMSYILGKTRKELEEVKDRFKLKEVPKNGVAINYLINSQKEITTYLKHDDFFKLLELNETYKAVKDKITFSYIEKFQDEFNQINCEEISHDKFMKFYDIAKLELNRLMYRSIVENDQIEVASYIKQFVKYVSNLILENKIEYVSNKINVDMINVINALKINKKFNNIDFFENKKGEDN